MKLKSILALTAAFTLSLATGLAAQAAPKVIIKTELASPVVLEKSQEKNYLRVSLTGFPMEVEKRSPINLAIVIDRSGSMSGDRIARARDAAIMAVNTLQSDDTLSIIAYDGDVEVIVPSTKVKNKKKMIKLIEQKVRAGGSTALFAGLSTGIDQVGRQLDSEKINRVILLSDGQANVGPTSVRELAELSRIAAKKGIAVTTVGIGDGYNEDLMTAIAGYSDGNHFFVNRVADLEKVFNNEFKDVMSVIAQDVIVTIRIADGVKPVRLLGREGEIIGNTINVRLNQLYANQEKYVLLEVVPAQGLAEQKKDLAEVQVRYANLNTKKHDDYSEKVRIRYSQSSTEIKQALNEDVVVETEIQKAALENEKAIHLMDQGKTEEAKAILRKNEQQMKQVSQTLQSEHARQKAQENATINRNLLEQLNNDANVSRKAIKENSYQTQNQQKSQY